MQFRAAYGIGRTTVLFGCTISSHSIILLSAFVANLMGARELVPCATLRILLKYSLDRDVSKGEETA